MKAYTGAGRKRTGASHIATLGVPPFIVERLLNHSDRSVTGLHDRYEYSNEKRAAIEQWSRKLQSVLFCQQGNLVEFPR